MKTKENEKSVIDFLNSIPDEKRKNDSLRLLEIMESVVKEKPKMWGSSIIGFGKYSYEYASGRKGEFMRIGFSPRKSNLTVYVMPGYEEYHELLDRIGPYTKGKSCLYIKDLDAIHVPTLKKLIKKGYKDIGTELVQKKIPKVDYKKEWKELYSAKTDPKTVTVPEQKIISIEGQGDPGKAKEYMDAIETLYPVAYKIKFNSKIDLKKDFVVMPLEGLWWAEDMDDFINEKRDNWKWKMFIVQPDFVTKKMFDNAIKDLNEKKKNLPLKSSLVFEKLKEGLAAQIMHIGPYDEEGPTIEKLHAYIEEEGGTLKGAQLHHEIYLGDPRKTDLKKLKTILRQPFLKK